MIAGIIIRIGLYELHNKSIIHKKNRYYIKNYVNKKNNNNSMFLIKIN